MLYLAGRSRLEIAYSVHQYARFSHNPRKSHEVEFKQISRYLQGINNKGTMMIPDKNNLSIDLYTYADFSGYTLQKRRWIWLA